MAFDFSKLNFFNRLDARARVFVLLGGIIAVVFLIYIGTRYFASDTGTVGPSSVANAPVGLQSVPGGTLTAEYSKALQQANTQAAQQAKMSGTSAVPTLMNYGNQPTTTAASCVVCSDENANVKTDLDQWVKQGKVSPEVSTALRDLADKNVSVDEYAAELDRLVKEGKLTPEQARQLLEKYKKQHGARALQESAASMDGLIKSGKLPVDVANQLLEQQKKQLSAAEYAAELQRLVAEGKVSPDVAQRLLAQYTQQRAKEIVQKSIASLRGLARAGQLIPEVEKELIGLEEKMVPLDTYAAALDRFVNAGKLIPAIAGKILDEFKWQKAAMGSSDATNQLVQKAEATLHGDLDGLLRSGKMSAETAQALKDAANKNISPEDYAAMLEKLVKEGKLSIEDMKRLLAEYKALYGMRAVAQKLNNLQANNAGIGDYEDELKRQVQAGYLTPEQAAELMRQYQAAHATVTTPVQTAASTEAFAALQQRLAEGDTSAPVASASEFVVEKQKEDAKITAEDLQARQQQIDAIMGAMSGQAGQLVNAWQAPTMASKQGVPDVKDTKSGKGAAGTTTSTSTTTTTDASALSTAAPLLKAGSIAFAVLDTQANSDYPDSPVMATIVEGPLKGAKLLGKLVATKGVSGQMDRISLNFTLMNNDMWPKSKTVTAYAIDPDTARTVLASTVDYHYLQRFGAMMATSFLQGYGNAVTTSGATATTGIFGTSSVNPALSPTQKIAAALGQMGQALGAATQNYINIPPTVKVDSGVGLGILFMTDVT